MLPNITSWNHATITVNSLVANCHIVVLGPEDYIIFEIKTLNEDIIDKIEIDKEYTNIQTVESFVSILNNYLTRTRINIRALQNNCVKFECETPFSILDLSYNMRMLIGLYCVTKFPILSEINPDYEQIPVEEEEEKVEEEEEEIEKELHYAITIEAVGFFISTPILYLISNLGDVNLHNSLTEGDKIQTNTVCMRIQNSFTPLMPLITSNADFVKKIPIGDITDFEVRLVDANLHDVKLLSPMWVTFTIQESPPDEKDAEDFWQFTYVKPQREPKQLINLNPKIIEDLNDEPLHYS